MNGAGDPTQTSRLHGCPQSHFIPPCHSDLRRPITKKSKVLPLGQMKRKCYAPCSVLVRLDLENSVHSTTPCPVQGGCEGIKQVPWRALKVVRDGDRCPARCACLSSTGGALYGVFCLLSCVPPCSKNGHTCRALFTHPQCHLHLLLLHSVVHQDQCSPSSSSIRAHSGPTAGSPFSSSLRVLALLPSLPQATAALRLQSHQQA